jgi:hypothetical protein
MDKPKLKRRECLRCDRPFMSEGAHHRLCKDCRAFLKVSDEGINPQPLRTKVESPE